jgi:hypothetical protein
MQIRRLTACPGCRRDLRTVYAGASFCPACGAALKIKRNFCTIASNWAAAIAAHLSQLFPCAGPPPLMTHRTAIVIGYSNALFRLGRRYERGERIAQSLRSDPLLPKISASWQSGCDRASGG